MSKPKPGKEMVRVTLAQEQSSDSPSITKELVADLRAALVDVFQDLGSSSRRWVRGKSEQEVAKAKEILSETIDRIGRLQLAVEAQEHNLRIEAAKTEAQLEADALNNRLTAIERAIKIVKDLESIGVKTNVTTVISQAGLTVGGDSDQQLMSGPQ